MGRSKVNSKVEKRLSLLKRKIMAPILEAKGEAKYEKSMLAMQGLEYRNVAKKNAFLEPSNPDAHFPQFVPAPIVDLRAGKSELSGMEHRGRFNKKSFGHIVELVAYDQPLDGDMGSELNIASEANTWKKVNPNNMANKMVVEKYDPNPEDELVDMMGGLTVGSKKTKAEKRKTKADGMAEETIAIKKKIIKMGPHEL